LRAARSADEERLLAKGERAMATKANALAVRGNVLMMPDRAIVPATFQQALKRDWKVVQETTCLAADKRHRHGTLTLAKPGFSNLFVLYIGSVKQNYRFGRPRLTKRRFTAADVKFLQSCGTR
jgi:hypothetical protein